MTVSRLTDMTIRGLSELADNLHWFCPRGPNDEHGCFYDEDCLESRRGETQEQKATREAKLQQAAARRNDVLEACKILAFDGPDAAQYQKTLKDGLQTQLTRCDVCVREYHRSRSSLQSLLESEYAEDEVQQFMEKFDGMNKARIGKGLDIMTETLMDLPPDQRTIATAGGVGTYALFEALNCGPFLQDEEALRRHFDKPFKLVQSKKKVKLPTYSPGMTAFLFSQNEQRSSWALRNFSTIKRPLTGSEFDNSAKPYLERALRRVNIVSLELEFLPTFWRATHLVLSKMTKHLVANLRSMDSNLYTVAMEHFQIDAAHFADLATSYKILLELSANDFWDAMGGINAQHVVESILRSPVLQRDMRTTEEEEPLRLEEKLAWVVPLIRSVKPANLVPPVRALLDQLLIHNQTDTYSKYAQRVTWTCGLSCLLETLNAMRKQVHGGPVTIHMIEVVTKDYMQLIMSELEGIETKDEERMEREELLGLDIVEAMLALDVQSLTHDRKVIERTKFLDHEVGLSGLNSWKMAMRVVKPGHPALATAITSGVAGLLPLETFTPRQVQNAPKYADAWNYALHRALSYVQTDLIERLESFSPEQLVDLFMEQKGAQGLLTLLFSGEERIHQTTLGVLKIMSNEDNRRDSIMHLVQAFFSTTLFAAAQAQTAVATSRVFGPCPILLRLSTDFFGCLFDSQDGVLRSRMLSQEQDLKSLGMLWQTTWEALETIFRETENWSNLGHDKQLMQDFCRETMDFADYAFDQYSVIANTLQEGSSSDGSVNEVPQQLLEFPTKAFYNIAKWLRLRDEYLISKAVSLTSKILVRLHEAGIVVEQKASQYIEDVVTSTDKVSKVKTRLSMNQKAELQRALEKHLGVNLSEDVGIDMVPKKQGTLAAWASSGRSTPVGDAKPKAGVIDVDAWSAASDAQRQRTQWRNEHDTAYRDLIDSATTASEAYKKKSLTAKPAMPAITKAAQKHQDDPKNFLLKRKQEKEAMEQRRAEALAKQKLGAGSGVAGLGDMGKDHSLKGQNVMVSSDEEESEEEDDLDDLFGTSKTKEKKRIARPNVDPDGALGLKPEVKKGPTRIQRMVRSTKDRRARLAPDLQPLHRTILKWDFFHEGDYPPGAEEHTFRGVANSFTDPVTYQQTFEPLLTLEAWQGLVRSREENTSKPYEIKVQSRSNVDSFIEIGSMIGHAENRELSLQEGDIVLLSKAKKPAEDVSAPHCLARIYKIKRQKAHLEILYQVMPKTSLDPILAMGQVVYGLKIQSITPLEREFGSLQGLQYYDLCQQIIKAAPSRRIGYSEKQITQCQDVWNVNRAQSEAINAALENEGFSLIQGPPGSGKTKTIVAIVGGLLSHVFGSSSSNGATRINLPKGADAGEDAPAKKLLVCAPSNAAVDELVMRLKEGVKTRSGRHQMPNIVRIGRSDAINTQVRDVTMEELVAKRLGTNDNGPSRANNAELFKEHEKISSQLREMYQKRDSGEVKGPDLTSLENDIVSVRKRKNDLGNSIDRVKDQERTAGRDAELSRKRARQAVLNEAHVICATLSGSGHDMFQSLNVEFETVIIDEAAQCVEMSSLIPLKYGCVKCVMVGDPKQLPPTVFSKEAAKFQYEQSLFVRMQNNFAGEVHLLDTQYRMHPEISIFPSRTFYDGLLKDGKGMAGLRQRPWHSSALLAPYRFFDVHGQHQSAPKGHSLINLAEIDVALALFERLTADFQTYQFAGRVGIITPYKSQLRALKDRFSGRFGNGIFDTIEFNTTDAFQGRESEIIIFSCVRASPAGGIGFLQDIRRMNVGLTRAKSSLWVLGNSESLVRGQFWRKLVEDAQARDTYTTGNIMSMLKKPSSAFPASTAKTHSMYDVGSHISQVDGQGDSRGSSTGGSRRTSEGNDSTLANPDPSRSSLPATKVEHTPFAGSAPAQDEGRMEGIRYRFQDRISKKAHTTPEAGSDRSSLQPERHPDEDVEMGEAESAGSGTATPLSNVAAVPSVEGTSSSRAETPLSGAEEGKNRAHGSVKPRPASVAPSVAPGVLKKRPAPSPFMPAKKPKPKR